MTPIREPVYTCRCGRAPVGVDGTVCAQCRLDEVNARLTANGAGERALLIRPVAPGTHAAGKPQHGDPSRSRVTRWASGSFGLAVMAGAVYLLAGHWFGDGGRAAVVWLLHTAALLALLAGGLVLFAAAMPDDVKEGSDG